MFPLVLAKILLTTLVAKSFPLFAAANLVDKIQHAIKDFGFAEPYGLLHPICFGKPGRKHFFKEIYPLSKIEMTPE